VFHEEVVPLLAMAPRVEEYDIALLIADTLHRRVIDEKVVV